MQRLRTLAVIAVIWAILGMSGLAHAAFVDNFRDWNLYVHNDDSGRTCYIASVPTDSEGNYSRRGPAAALVAKLPAAPPNEQVSVQPGYPFLEGSEVDLTIGSRTWKLFTQGEHAWAKDSDADVEIIAAMKAGTTMTVRGTSQKDTFSLDTYSLLGFTAAYEAMRDACS